MKKLEELQVIAFTHKSLGINELGKLHLEEQQAAARFGALKNSGMTEVMFLSTCNRVEFLIASEKKVTASDSEKLLAALYPGIATGELKKFAAGLQLFSGKDALAHLFRVASSLDSLVVGEREIITQVRNAYELCRKEKLSGDLIRLAIQKTIECAKAVYSQTNIAKNPVSVVSLAYRKLKELHVKLDAKFLIIGAGITNTTMAKYLKKHGFSAFTVFNRTLANAEKLAAELGGKPLPLDALKTYRGGFDVIVTCTGAPGAVVTKEAYSALIGNDTSKKIVIDLAVPNDLDEEILKSYDVNLIAVNNLQDVAKKNLLEREKELAACEKIISEHLEEFETEFKERIVELAMSDVPRKVKEIREAAVNEVFAKDIEKLDDRSKEVLEKVISYLEKKYISVPMKMAKEIMLEK